MLAEIGLSVLNALKHDNINLSNAPGLVLLPSSLYKTCETRRSNKASYPTVSLQCNNIQA